jgi:hypothetical protein
MNRPCVHGEVCGFYGEYGYCRLNGCSHYQPSLLPVLKRWRDLLGQQQKHYHQQMDVEYGILSVQKNLLYKIIAHMEKEAKRG